MSRPPQYAPKSRYRTRQSGSEVEAIDDNSATAIDRVVPDLDELERQYGPKPEAPPTRQPPAKPGPSRALVVALALALGIAVLLAAALGAALYVLFTR